MGTRDTFQVLELRCHSIWWKTYENFKHEFIFGAFTENFISIVLEISMASPTFLTSIITTLYTTKFTYGTLGFPIPPLL